MAFATRTLGILATVCAGSMFGGVVLAAPPSSVRHIESTETAIGQQIALSLNAPADMLLQQSADGRSLQILVMAGGSFRDLPAQIKVRKIGSGASAAHALNANFIQPVTIRGVTLERGTAEQPARLLLDIVPSTVGRTWSTAALPWASLPTQAARTAQMLGQGSQADRQLAVSVGDMQLAELPIKSDPILEAERDRIFSDLLRNPGNLEASLRYADVSIKLNDLEGAVIAYERLLLLNPNQSRVRYELAVLYYKLQSAEMARVYLDGVLTDPQAPAEITNNARQLMAALDGALQQRGFSGSAMAGVRYQTNATAAASSDTIRSRGSDVARGAQNGEKPDWNGFASLSLRHLYPTEDGKGGAIDTDVIAYGTRQFDESSLNVGLMDIRSGYRLRPIDGDRSFNIRPHVLMGGTLLDDHLYNTQYGFGLDISKQISQSWSVDATVDYRFKNFYNFGERLTNSALSGWETGAQLRTRYAVTESQFLGLELGVRDGQTRQDYNDFTEYAVNASYTLRYQAPFGLTDLPWIVSVNAGHFWTNYDAADPLIDPGTKRRDREWRTGFSNVVPLSQEWALILQVLNSHVDSTLPNYSYKNLSTLFGLTRSF